MTVVNVHVDFGAQENEVCYCFHFFLHLFAMKWWDQMHWFGYIHISVYKFVFICINPWFRYIHIFVPHFVPEDKKFHTDKNLVHRNALSGLSVVNKLQFNTWWLLFFWVPTTCQAPCLKHSVYLCSLGAFLAEEQKAGGPVIWGSQWKC